MTTLVLTGCFVYGHNRLEVARQEYELAKLDHISARQKYAPSDPRRILARERRIKTFAAWRVLKRGY